MKIAVVTVAVALSLSVSVAKANAPGWHHLTYGVSCSTLPSLRIKDGGYIQCATAYGKWAFQISTEDIYIWKISRDGSAHLWRRMEQ